ncbi:PAS domain S-box-containing protein [Halanaerobium saccharolyticum]|uniref:Oxygen sensor histidine kinase NreB n=1 Tax=Halanaerobium saccharolyticum TaxID=43595 RepID=A0A4V3CFV1_9FIRM|nr:histidine kinase N-terminal 7TM domain-containing protein [Halanaerobium saccharolyticum]TDO95272.1 PAS domain S-box-containing protein [Halanaerobium saccharolyticum]
MNYHFVPYLIPLAISFTVMIILAFYSYKNCNVKGAKAFVLNMILGAIWAGANALEMAGSDFSTKIIWANLQYLVYAFAPLVWLTMVLQFSSRENLVNKKNLVLMSIIPVITVFLAWTDQYHGLIRSNFALKMAANFSYITKDYGPWFWVHFVYSYFLNLSTVYFLLKTVWLNNKAYRKQAFYLLTGFLILMISNFLYVSKLTPLPEFDFSPITISISGLIIARGIFHFRLFDIVPVARATVIENINSGMIVIDTQNRIIDINPKAESMFKIKNEDIYGKNLKDLSVQLVNIYEDMKNEQNQQQELTYFDQKNKHYYELFISTIKDYRQKKAADILIINDVSKVKKARDQIIKQQQKLAVKEERERLSRDLHDNLGQVLSFSNVQIQAARKELKNENFKKTDRYLKRLNQIINNAHKDVREYAYSIRNDYYSKQNINQLFKNEISYFENNCHLVIKTKFKEKFNYNFGTEEITQLHFILKEALTNILKHAEAEIIWVELVEENGIKLVIKDNGKGITVEDYNSGSGLSIMKERTHLIGGVFKINSEPQKGTSIIVNLSNLESSI